MDKQLEKELDDLLCLRGSSRLYIKLAEQIGTAQLLKAKSHKLSLIDRLRRIDRRLK